MKKKKVNWRSGDIFAIPLNESLYGFGQIVSHEPDCLDSVLCMLFSDSISSIDDPAVIPKDLKIISVELISRESLDDSLWPIVGNQKTTDVLNLYPIERLRENGYIGAKVRGSSIIDDFMAAYHGLIPWDSYADKAYFDKLLIPGMEIPKKAFFSDN